jgi:hypothetical protein
MDLDYGERYEDFRLEVRAFLEEHKGERPVGPYFEVPRAELSH